MQGFAVSLDELARCRELVQREADHFGEICSRLAMNDMNDSVLGPLSPTTKLGMACQRVNAAARAQLLAARRVLSRRQPEARRRFPADTRH